MHLENTVKMLRMIKEDPNAEIPAKNSITGLFRKELEEPVNRLCHSFAPHTHDTQDTCMRHRGPACHPMRARTHALICDLENRTNGSGHASHLSITRVLVTTDSSTIKIITWLQLNSITLCCGIKKLKIAGKWVIQDKYWWRHNPSGCGLISVDCNS